jgi:predicted RND superfamily exporter protein
LVGFILAVASGFYTAHHFAINTDINTLISSKLDWRQRDQQFDGAFERDNTILAVVEAPTPELVGQAAAALEQKLKGDTKNFVSMQPLGSGEFFEKKERPCRHQARRGQARQYRAALQHDRAHG